MAVIYEVIDHWKFLILKFPNSMSDTDCMTPAAEIRRFVSRSKKFPGGQAVRKLARPFPAAEGLFRDDSLWLYGDDRKIMMSISHHHATNKTRRDTPAGNAGKKRKNKQWFCFWVAHGLCVL